MAGGWWRRTRNRSAVADEAAESADRPEGPRRVGVSVVNELPSSGAEAASPWPVDLDGPTAQYPILVPQSPADPRLSVADTENQAALDGPQDDDDEVVSPRLPRLLAAEIGMYTGAGLVVLSGVLAGYAAWPGWSTAVRAGVLLTVGVGAFACSAWLRSPGQAQLGPRRVRAMSCLLALGVLGLVGAGCVLCDGSWGQTAAVLGVGLGSMLVVTRRLPSAAAETGVLVLAIWLAVSSSSLLGVWMYPVIAALGGLWAALGWRWAHGQRTAAVSGAVVGLGACVAAANGAAAWPARAAILAVGLLSLLRFWRGGRNYWLALGVASLAALAATLAGAAFSPLLALAAGGVAVLVFSWAALRAAQAPADRV